MLSSITDHRRLNFRCNPVFCWSNLNVFYFPKYCFLFCSMEFVSKQAIQPPPPSTVAAALTIPLSTSTPDSRGRSKKHVFVFFGRHIPFFLFLVAFPSPLLPRTHTPGGYESGGNGRGGKVVDKQTSFWPLRKGAKTRNANKRSLRGGCSHIFVEASKNALFLFLELFLVSRFFGHGNFFCFWHLFVSWDLSNTKLNIIIFGNQAARGNVSCSDLRYKCCGALVILLNPGLWVLHPGFFPALNTPGAMFHGNLCAAFPLC